MLQKPINSHSFKLSVFFTLFCTTWFSFNLRAQISKAAQEDDIREAIVRYQIAKLNLDADVFYLDIQSKDPTEQFMRRFTDVTKPIRKGSLWGEQLKPERRGVVFRQETVRWTSHALVKVEGGYYCGGLHCAATGTFRVERRANRWIVTEFKVSTYS